MSWLEPYITVLVIQTCSVSSTNKIQGIMKQKACYKCVEAAGKT